MLNRLLTFLNLSSSSGTRDFTDAEIAIVALLIRAATSDANFSEEERTTIRHLVSESFKLAPSDLERLIKLAENEEERTLDLHRWTQAIKHTYDAMERIAFIEKMWEVVYADGKLDDFEANLLRRVTGLIYVPDHESREARRRVLARLDIKY